VAWRVGQAGRSLDAADLSYRLRSLPMAGAVLQVGAHPDDEDSGLLAYLAHGLCVRTVYWSATRGEAGQNRLNSYRGEALGVFRTWESEDARAIDGAEALFGPFYDFGYSKSGSDTLSKWGRDAVVREIVRAIRLVQPDIVIARWTGQPADEHGHHQAIGQLTPEAFRAAGDPDRFPELRELGMEAWRPRRLFQSVGGDWTPEQNLASLGAVRDDLEQEGLVRIDAGALDPIGGRTFQEQGWSALNEHRSQGMAFLPGPGRFVYYYRLIQGSADDGTENPSSEGGLFKGLDPTLTGLADHAGEDSGWLREQLHGVKGQTEEALAAYHSSDATSAGRHLLAAASATRELISRLGSRLGGRRRVALSVYLERKLADLEEAAAACLGLRLECRSEAVHVIPGESFEIQARLWGYGPTPVDTQSIRLHVPPDCRAEEDSRDQRSTVATPGVVAEADFRVSVPRHAALSSPYWLVEPPGRYAYRWPAERFCSRPFRPPRFEAECEIQVEGQRLVIRAPALSRSAFPGGVRELYPAVIPPVSLRAGTSVVCMPAAHEEAEEGRRPLPEPFEPDGTAAEGQIALDVLARNHSERTLTGRLELEAPSWIRVKPSEIDVSLGAVGSRPHSFTLTTPASPPPGTHPLRFRMDVEGRSYAHGLMPVRMGMANLAGDADAASCIRETFLLTPSEVGLHVIDARFARSLRYAYVAGVEEDFTRHLEPFGARFHMVDDDELQRLDLSRFDAIVIGPGAYSARAELRAAAPRVLDYMDGGGTLIVQYQPYSYRAPGLAPYPFRYSEPHDRVTDEGAPVRFLEPDHSIFRVPNRIGEQDFDGWLHERGRYFFGEWDRRYRPLLSCADPGEDPKLGGLLVADYGRGTYVYCGYSLYRQLPAGVPGAFRLFANLLALPAVRLTERIEFMKGTELFASLPHSQLATLAKIASERHVEDGTVISSEGDPAREVYVIREGEVSILKRRNGREEQLRICGKGACIGEVAALGKVARSASIVARGPARLIVLEEEQLERLLEAQPEVSRALLVLLAKRMATQPGPLG
jgi:LmbE family N-acetylglucosaminyl deacetylase